MGRFLGSLNNTIAFFNNFVLNRDPRQDSRSDPALTERQGLRSGDGDAAVAATANMILSAGVDGGPTSSTAHAPGDVIPPGSTQNSGPATPSNALVDYPPDLTTMPPSTLSRSPHHIAEEPGEKPQSPCATTVAGTQMRTRASPDPDEQIDDTVSGHLPEPKRRRISPRPSHDASPKLNPGLNSPGTSPESPKLGT